MTSLRNGRRQARPLRSSVQHAGHDRQQSCGDHHGDGDEIRFARKKRHDQCPQHQRIPAFGSAPDRPVTGSKPRAGLPILVRSNSAWLHINTVYKNTNGTYRQSFKCGSGFTPCVAKGRHGAEQRLSGLKRVIKAPMGRDTAKNPIEFRVWHKPHAATPAHAGRCPSVSPAPRAGPTARPAPRASI